MTQKTLSLKVWIILAFLVTTVFTSPAFAQFDKGQVSGFVHDAKEAAVQRAVVKAVNAATRTEYETVTVDSGYFVFTNLMPGKYDVSVEMPGFKRYLQISVDVDAASKVRIDAVLEPGGIAETITVAADDGIIQHDSAQVATTVESREIQDLALNGRNPINLVLLAPGVRGGPFNSFNPDDVGAIGFSVNGSRLEENLITIDGVIATRTRASGAMIGVLNADTVQEVQILTSNYLPEFGRSSGGQVRFVTRSGGRDFHGGLFEFFRNSALDANSWGRNASNNPDLARKPAPFTYNQFGYHVGGPVYLPAKFNEGRRAYSSFGPRNGSSGGASILVSKRSRR